MINNRVQAYYIVNKLEDDLRIGKMENLVPQYLRSGIEVFSHQVYASTFAVSNPFVKGFILADEAGLGKTMEALLILAQYRRLNYNILVVVPSPTIDNWLHDIVRTFEFHCYVLDNKDRRATESYATNLNKFKSGIVLTTYDYVMANPDKFREHDWQVCILDEAHRFRSYKIKENKTAETILSIIPNAKKILLTATPIQKNEDDVFGLINFIDDSIFTDYEDFHKRYFRKPENYGELRDIIAPYTFRTLRNQVKIETKLPERQILTQVYEMTEKEKKLYSLIEQYVAKPVKQAFPEMAPYELALMLYGTLSSSAYALSKTLSGIYARLNKKATDENLKEAKEIKEMLDLATSITTNNKDELLVKALKTTFTALNKKNVARKCVIFTSNTQSQDHIHKLLKIETDYSIYSFNGTTDNEPITKFLRAENPSVLISTDKGNESLNWQDSAFVVNYDFPQVLLDMEQRISRCHRIGQTSDVFVLNFICPENFSDVRMYELFYKRVNTSNSIIGASDTIISGAVDGKIEDNIKDIFQNVRRKKEIQIDFDELTEQFKEELKEVKTQSNDILFNTFSKLLVERTRNMGQIIKQKVTKLDGTIKDLARYFFKDSFIDENTFTAKTSFHQKNYFAEPFRFSLSNAEGCYPFKISSEPCQKMLFELGSTRELKPHKLVFVSDDKRLSGVKGYIAVNNLSVIYGFDLVRKVCLVGLDEKGDILDNKLCDEILTQDCVEFVENIDIPTEIVAQLDNVFEITIPSLIEPIKKDLDKDVNLPISHLQMLAEREKSKLEKQIKDLSREIEQIKNTNASDSFGAGLAKNQKINELSEQLFELKDNEFIEKSKINKETKQKIEELKNKAKINYTKSNAVVVYFEVR